MNLFDRAKIYIDYNNHYTITKGLRTLDIEFNKAIKTNNMPYAKVIIDVVQKLYEEFSSSYRESEDYGETMSYAQRTMADKMRKYILYLIRKIKINPQKEIKQVITPQ